MVDAGSEMDRSSCFVRLSRLKLRLHVESSESSGNPDRPSVDRTCMDGQTGQHKPSTA